MKKLNVLLTTAAILALTGCSSNSKPAETTAAQTTAAATTAAETTAAETTAAEKKDASGTLTVYTSQPEADIQALVEEYNKSCPDVKVEIFRSGTEEGVSKVLAEK